MASNLSYLVLLLLKYTIIKTIKILINNNNTMCLHKMHLKILTLKISLQKKSLFNKYLLKKDSSI